METLLGGLLGGLLRIAPEFLKWMDRKAEREHERLMLEKNLEADKLRGEQSLALENAKGQFSLDIAGLEALKEGIKAQGQMTGNKWADGLNQLMRPIIAMQWVVILYPGVIIASMIVVANAGGTAADIIKVFGVEEKAIAAGIINFFFLNRVFAK